MLENVSHAILSKVNQLGTRYGLEPYDFIATVRPETQPNDQLGGTPDLTGRTMLCYETGPGDEVKFKQFERMVEAVGVNADTGALVGDDRELLTALDAAIRRAPKPRTPFG
jgi:hypothetical protein